jgi:hypothetical protein
LIKLDISKHHIYLPNPTNLNNKELQKYIAGGILIKKVLPRVYGFAALVLLLLVITPVEHYLPRKYEN